jgi:hypothetical protein
MMIPGMKSQDLQRLIRLDLEPLGKDVPKLNLTPRTWRDRGARLKRLLIDRWESWDERLAEWRRSLELEGVGGRDADNWGTVLAMADMAMQADIGDEAMRESWAKRVAYIVANDQADTANDAEAMLSHLLTQPFEVYRAGEQFTVAQWIMAAAGLPGAPSGLLGRNAPGDAVGDDPMSRQKYQEYCNATLAKAGIRVDGRGKGIEARLFLANTPTHYLRQFFQNSDWAGGAWKQSAARVPGAELSKNPLTLAGMRSRGVFMPVRSIPGFAAFPMDQGTAPDPVEAEDSANPDHFA